MYSTEYLLCALYIYYEHIRTFSPPWVKSTLLIDMPVPFFAFFPPPPDNNIIVDLLPYKLAKAGKKVGVATNIIIIMK